VVPMLLRILDGSDPFGEDLAVVLDTMEALASFRDDRALPPVTAMARQRRWLAWDRTKRLRSAALTALTRIGSERAKAAVADLARTGDFFLRRMAAATLRKMPA